MESICTESSLFRQEPQALWEEGTVGGSFHLKKRTWSHAGWGNHKRSAYRGQAVVIGQYWDYLKSVITIYLSIYYILRPKA